MDSPISITSVHPYGRRRRGANGRTGEEMPEIDTMCVCPFITG